MRKDLLLTTLVLGAVALGCQSNDGELTWTMFENETKDSRESFRKHFDDLKDPEKHIEQATKYAIQELRLNASEIKFVKENAPIIENNTSNTFVVYYWELPGGEGLEVLSSGTGLTMVSAKRGLRGIIIPE